MNSHEFFFLNPHRKNYYKQISFNLGKHKERGTHRKKQRQFCDILLKLTVSKVLFIHRCRSKNFRAHLLLYVDNGCDTFGPKRIWSPAIWTPTIGPQLIGSSGQTNSVPMDKWSPTNLLPCQMVPNQFGLLYKWSLEYSDCPERKAVGIQKSGDQMGWGPFFRRNQIVRDHLTMGTKFDGDNLSRGINIMGIICPGGQEVGDRKSGDQMSSGPNVSQPFQPPKF